MYLVFETLNIVGTNHYAYLCKISSCFGYRKLVFLKPKKFKHCFCCRIFLIVRSLSEGFPDYRALPDKSTKFFTGLPKVLLVIFSLGALLNSHWFSLYSPKHVDDVIRRDMSSFFFVICKNIHLLHLIRCKMMR